MKGELFIMKNKMNRRIASFILASTLFVSGCTGKAEASSGEELVSDAIEVTTSNLSPNVCSRIVIDNAMNIIKEMVKRHLEKLVVKVDNFAYVSQDTILYDEELNELESIDKYQKLFVIEKGVKVSAVMYYKSVSEVITGFVYNDSYEELSDVFVEVDISDQVVNLYVDGENTLSSSVVTGKNSTPTRIGYFDIDSKSRSTSKGKVILKGPGYRSPVDFWMPFDGGIGLHNAPWRSKFGGEIYKKSGSHGCVNMDYDTASEIYSNVEVGTRVLVHK